MGPAVNEEQLKTDLNYVEIGKSEGAKLLSGGNRLDKGDYAHGWFMEPTVFARRQSEDAHRAGRDLRPGGLDHSLATTSKTPSTSPTESNTASRLLFTQRMSTEPSAPCATSTPG